MTKTADPGLLTKHPLAIVFCFIFFCLTPVMLMRDFTPDNELRYLSIADEAIENGNVFAFTLQGQPYADKPPLYLWIVMLAKLLMGKHSMFLLSLFSFIPALVIIWVMDKWLKLQNAVDRMTVAFMMMSCVLFLGMSVFLRMDMLMSMFIILALYSFWLLYKGEGNRRLQQILLPVWIFLALFTKGPVGIMMPPLAIIVFLLVKKQGREIGKYLGWRTWGIIALLCAIWFTGVYLDGGKSYLNNLLFHQTVGRAVNSFHHKNPLWYYLEVVWYVVAPYCFLLVGALIVSLIKPKEKQRSDEEVFFATTIISTFVMLSCFSAKLAIYFSPVMPFMVLLFVEVLKRTGWKKWMTWSLAVPFILLAALFWVALGARLFAYSNPHVVALLSPYAFLSSKLVWFAVGLLAAGLTASVALLFKGRWNIAIMMAAISLLLGLYSASSAMHSINDWVGYGNICSTIKPDEQVSTVYVKRSENMDVYLHRPVKNYEKDFKAFYEGEMSPSADHSAPKILVTSSRALEKDADLKAFCEDKARWFVGPYCVVSIPVEEQQIAGPEAEEEQSQADSTAVKR